MESMDWKFLPDAGGLLDQDDALMRDLTTISWRKAQIEKMLKNTGSVQVGRHVAPSGSEQE